MILHSIKNILHLDVYKSKVKYYNIDKYNALELKFIPIVEELGFKRDYNIGIIRYSLVIKGVLVMIELWESPTIEIAFIINNEVTWTKISGTTSLSYKFTKDTLSKFIDNYINDRLTYDSINN